MEHLENEKITSVYIEEEMKNAYMDYAMSVIIGRALPDVKDGLKPVHRRILYAMYKEGLFYNKRYSKCAGVVGEVLKKYHPHGDAAVYDSLVRMAQEWNMRYILIDGQGNFGSVDGDPPAAYRYTEARMSRLAGEMLADIEKETVSFSPNFDESTLEPDLLPSKSPNLLINGSAGIAVGMATNVPPHNLREVIDGTIAFIESPDITIDELMTHIHGPDFPTAGFINGREGIINAYKTGRGLIQVRAKADTEPLKGDKEAIIITELPYQVNKAKLIEKVADLVREKKVEGISAIRDESDRDGMRIVIELKKGEVGKVILNKLYKHTQLQDTFGVIMLAIVEKQPKILNLKEILSLFVQHRKDVVTKRTIFDLRKSEERAHILEGIKIAIDNIDEVITIIRGAASPDIASNSMIAKFGISEIQASAILEMRLQRLTGMERNKVILELEEVRKDIIRFKEILASDAIKFNIIKNELLEIKKDYGDERRTKIVDREMEFDAEDFIADEDMVVAISHTGYIKRNPLTLYRSQKRGGKGVMGMETKEEDFVEEIFIASTHSYIMFFTNIGKVHWLKVHEIPEAGRVAKGKAIINLIQLAENEKVTAYMSIKEFQEGLFIIMATEQGVIKKTELMEYSNTSSRGIIAINLDDNDKLISVKLTDGKGNIFMATKMGYSICFKEEDIRTIGRVGRGVRGITLRDDDIVIGMECVNENISILTVTEKGYGKKSGIEDYRIQGRGGKGVINIKITEKNGSVIGIKGVTGEDELMIITQGGQVIRFKLDQIREVGRSTQGVRMINLEGEDKVVSIARFREDEEEEEVLIIPPLGEDEKN